MEILRETTTYAHIQNLNKMKIQGYLTKNWLETQMKEF